MKIVNRYLIKNFLGPFVLTFFVALFVLLMQFLWKWVDELVGKGLEISVLLQLMFYAAITLTSMAFPLAVLLSSLMTFGNLGERYEIVALKSAGISTRRMMRPLAIVALIIAAIAFEFSNDVIPRATIKLRMLLYDVQEQKPALNIDEGVFYNGFDNYTIRVGKKLHDNETVQDILIYDHSRRQGNTTVTYAKRGTMKMTPDKHYLLFTLYDGSFWDENFYQRNTDGSQHFPLTRASFAKQYKRFDMSEFQVAKVDQSMYESHSTTMSIGDLNHKIDTMKTEISSLAHEASYVFFSNLYYFNNFVQNDSSKFDHFSKGKALEMNNIPPEQQSRIFHFAENASRSFIYSVRFAYQDMMYRTSYMWSFQIEFFRKFTLAFACVLFFFIGAPLGSIIRKGGIGIPLVITVVFFTLYFALSIMGEKISKGSLLPVWFGMGLSSFILIPICIFLTYQASTDSALFAPDTYSKFAEKIKNLKLFHKRHENSTTLS